jgi:hypothetical protein
VASRAPSPARALDGTQTTHVYTEFIGAHENEVELVFDDIAD